MSSTLTSAPSPGPGCWTSTTAPCAISSPAWGPRSTASPGRPPSTSPRPVSSWSSCRWPRTWPTCAGVWGASSSAEAVVGSGSAPRISRRPGPCAPSCAMRLSPISCAPARAHPSWSIPVPSATLPPDAPRSSPTASPRQVPATAATSSPRPASDPTWAWSASWTSSAPSPGCTRASPSSWSPSGRSRPTADATASSAARTCPRRCSRRTSMTCATAPPTCSSTCRSCGASASPRSWPSTSSPPTTTQRSRR